MGEKGSSNAGSVIGTLLLLAVMGWTAAVFGLSHVNMTNSEALSHTTAMNQITYELGLHRIDVDPILIPKLDGSLDIFLNRTALESMPYPYRDEFAVALADIWCSQVSTFLLPAVHVRDVQTGPTLITKSCLFQSSPEIAGNYSGTVYNNTVSVDSTFEVQLVETTSGIKGCMQVALPLIGTGPVSGTLDGRNLVVTLTAPDVQIRFDGNRVGHSITGHYTVMTNGQTGTFTLHQDVPRVNTGFDPDKCPR